MRGIGFCARVAIAMVAAGFSFSHAQAADLPAKALPLGCTPAVDGFNGKLGAVGGSFANNTLAGGTGSLSIPIDCEFGAQIDGTAASLNGRFLGQLAGHMFWRNPAAGLFGLYGSYSQYDQLGGVKAMHVGPEAEWYAGRWTLQGVAGLETGNTVSAVVGPVTQTYQVDTRFFDQLNVAYYVQDNLKVYVGHRYLYGVNSLALGGEWGMPLGHGVMGALFAEARVGENDYHGIWGGLRFYFGQKDKTLIRRHREDDPNNWDDTAFGLGTTGSTAPAPPQCTPPAQMIDGVCQIPE